MPTLLLAENQVFWPAYQRILVSLFKFLSPSLSESRLSDPVRILYQATLRILLVLLHDFPEFLSDNHLSFIDVLPHSCIQLRNLILSAFPRNMRLPDPFTPNLKVDHLPDIDIPPRILSDYQSVLKTKNIKQDLDIYLKGDNPSSFLTDLIPKLLLDSANVGSRYNVQLINALVLHLGVSAITKQGRSDSISMEIFQHLARDLDSEGRYIFLSGLANHLRFSNAHTHYFSVVVLFLFEDSNAIIQEQITRYQVD